MYFAPKAPLRMPCANFDAVVSMSAEEAYAFLMDPQDMSMWDPSVVSVTKLESDEGGRPRWEATLRRLLCGSIVYTLAETDEFKKIVFEGVSKDGGVTTREQYDIIEDTTTPGMSRVVYTVTVALRGWRRLPCATAITWIQLYKDSAEARIKLSSIKVEEGAV